MQIGERQYRTLVKELITNNLIHTIMNATLFNASLRSNCLGEFVDNDGNYNALYLQFNDTTNCIEVSSVCNAGLIVEFSTEYDDDFSLDKNLQELLEPIYNAGYSDIEY